MAGFWQAKSVLNPAVSCGHVMSLGEDYLYIYYAGILLAKVFPTLITTPDYLYAIYKV